MTTRTIPRLKMIRQMAAKKDDNPYDDPDEISDDNTDDNANGNIGYW
jgi:hypothetical protein